MTEKTSRIPSSPSPLTTLPPPQLSIRPSVEPSVGSKGDSYDNALAETINGLYKAELIHRRAHRGELKRRRNWPRWNGCPSSTTTACSNPSIPGAVHKSSTMKTYKNGETWTLDPTRNNIAKYWEAPFDQGSPAGGYAVSNSGTDCVVGHVALFEPDQAK